MFKRTFITFSLLLACVLGPAHGQTSDQVIDQLKATMMAGDAAGLAQQTMNPVEITQFGEGRYYSKGQATLLLKAFFKDYPPHDFAIVTSTKTRGAWFVEGIYTPKNSDSTLRLFIRMRVSEGTWKVREFLIEKSDE